MPKMRLKEGAKFRGVNPDGTRTQYSGGDVVEVSEAQLTNFRDIFVTIPEVVEAPPKPAATVAPPTKPAPKAAPNGNGNGNK